MKNGATYFKWSIVLIGIIAIVYLSRSCNCGKPKTVEIVKIKIDTVWQQQDTFISYIPKPYKVEVPKKEVIEVLSDSLVLANAIKDGIISHQLDSLSVLRDYLTKRYYSDSFKVEYGKIYTYDTVAFNQLLGKGIATSFKIPIVTKTVTIEAQKRNVVLFGVGLIGNKVSPLYGTEATLDWKMKSDKTYEIGAVLLRGGDLYYKTKILIPIHLHKN